MRSASRNNAINIINGIAAVGIIVGALALFVVLSVFSGLKDFSLSFSNSFDPDLKAIATSGKSILITEAQKSKLYKIEEIEQQSLVIEERVLFMFNGKEIVTYIKGVDSLFEKVNDVKSTLFQGEWLDPNSTQVVIGYGIHQKLSLGLLDYNSPLEVFVPRPGKGAIENPKEAFNKGILAPVGIYAISEDLDEKYVFADLAFTQELLDYKPNQISGMEFKLKAGVSETDAIEKIESILGKDVKVKNRAQLNDALYKMLNTENIAVYLIFTLVIIIALFNLIGALIMMVLDKRANLITMYNLGAEIKDLRQIFLLQGTLLSLVAGAMGLILGIAIVLIQQHFKIIMITPTLAYPVVFLVQNVLIVFATIAILGFLASWIASTRVSLRLFEK